MCEDRLRVRNAHKSFFDIYTPIWTSAHVGYIVRMHTAYRRPITAWPSVIVLTTAYNYAY